MKLAATAERAHKDQRATRPPLPILTSLRFFAAAEVVAYHFAKTSPAWAFPDSFLNGLVSGGYAAVAFFFLLSGFILTYVYAGPAERDGCRAKSTVFWKLRLARIAPAYYLGLLLGLQIAVKDLAAGGTSTFSTAVELMLAPLFLQAWWSPAIALWNFPGWSVSVECLFYALFPWLARVSARVPRTTLFAVTYALIVVATVDRADFLSLPAPLFHLPQFVFGMALGRLYLHGLAFSARLHAAMLGIGICVLVAIFGFTWMLPWWTQSDAVLVLVFGLIVFGGAGASASNSLLAHPLLVLLGEASYAIYILHIPLRLSWISTTEALGIRLPDGVNFGLYFAFVAGVSVVVYRQVEIPLRRRIAGRRGLPLRRLSPA